VVIRLSQSSGRGQQFGADLESRSPPTGGSDAASAARRCASLWTAGGAISTIPDLAVYVKALVGGGLLGAKTRELRLDSIQPTDAAEPEAAGYGLGASPNSAR
jgi:CubicO group peptidase (beta-lactamase class C family)